jgi:hypothetical protein
LLTIAYIGVTGYLPAIIDCCCQRRHRLGRFEDVSAISTMTGVREKAVRALIRTILRDW